MWKTRCNLCLKNTINKYVKVEEESFTTNHDKYIILQAFYSSQLCLRCREKLSLLIQGTIDALRQMGEWDKENELDKKQLKLPITSTYIKNVDAEWWDKHALQPDPD